MAQAEAARNWTALWRTVRIGISVRYTLAAAAALSALAVALTFAPVRSDDSIAASLFLAAVGVSGWYGGIGPALLATAIGAIAIDYLFELPPYTLEVTSWRTLLDLAAFLLVATLLGSLNGRLRSSNVQLRAERDRAQAAVAARDELMTAVSHGLRTPLTVIKASLYSLHDPALDLSPGTRDHLLANTEAEVDRLIHFVTEALALRKLENTVSPRWEWIAPSELASAVLDRCLPALGSRPAEFAVPDDLPPVRVDATLMDQALTVLLENVAAHTPPESPIRIDASLHARELRISVSDAGPGIPAAARQRIFDKYERLDEASSGLGLGLAIARAAVEAQGGRVWVDESPLGGARFVVSIPRSTDTGEARDAN
ncbi:MAG: PAS domain-containing sensor histidine kinase [Chloroflexi bacterium]|nr:PAS domain-containing sensor histidine kinase [Chloroflexota bacterium]